MEPELSDMDVLLNTARNTEVLQRDC